MPSMFNFKSPAMFIFTFSIIPFSYANELNFENASADKSSNSTYQTQENTQKKQHQETDQHHDEHEADEHQEDG